MEIFLVKNIFQNVQLSANSSLKWVDEMQGIILEIMTLILSK